jgi:hypothetical protein
MKSAIFYPFVIGWDEIGNWIPSSCICISCFWLVHVIRRKEPNGLVMGFSHAPNYLEKFVLSLESNLVCTYPLTAYQAESTVTYRDVYCELLLPSARRIYLYCKANITNVILLAHFRVYTYFWNLYATLSSAMRRYWQERAAAAAFVLLGAPLCLQLSCISCLCASWHWLKCET